MAVSKGRESNPAMSYGVCGEHGGDPSSIKRFFKDANVDYVSCSPYRVPIARLSAGPCDARITIGASLPASGDDECGQPASMIKGPRPREV